jgi:hypothetical protein
MGREIKSYQDAKVLPSEANNYKDRLLKLIPSEIIAAYITLHGLILGIKNPNEDKLLWIVIAILFVLTPIYLYKVSMVTKKRQIFISTFGFLVWVFTTNPPDINIWDIPTEFLGSLVFILYTLFIPLFYKCESRVKNS